MKIKEIRKLSVADLQKTLQDSLKELFNLRMQRSAGQTPKSHLFKQVRVRIARIKTLLTEKKVAS